MVESDRKAEGIISPRLLELEPYHTMHERLQVPEHKWNRQRGSNQN